MERAVQLSWHHLGQPRAASRLPLSLICVGKSQPLTGLAQLTEAEMGESCWGLGKAEAERQSHHNVTFYRLKSNQGPPR